MSSDGIRDPRGEAEARFVLAGLLPLAPREIGQDPREAAHRAALATLRRGLGKELGTVIDMYRYVSPYLPAGATRNEENAYFLVASLFGLHPKHWARTEDRKPMNLGASFALMMSKDTVSPSVERRFEALLSASSETLPDHLRQAVSLLRSHDVPVDYLQLLRDIQRWEWENRQVQRAWAGAFWNATREGDQSTDRASASSTSPAIVGEN